VVYKNPKYSGYQSDRVVVLPFKDAEGQIERGEIAASIFETTLLSTEKFEVVERRQLDKILAEQNLSLTGLIENPVAVGKLVKADVMVTGTVKTMFKGNAGGYKIISASIKGVYMETGVTIWSIDKMSTFTDGLPMYSWDVVAKTLCRDMIDALMEK
jgi:curli biogenesis system outer membrane secretion channel CsgG